jgi:glycosyl hydrolase family 113
MKRIALRNAGFWLIGTYLVYLTITLILVLIQGTSISEIKEFFPVVNKQILTNPIGWILLITPLALFHLFKYLFNSWKNRSPLVFLKRFSFFIVLPVAFIFSGFNFSKWYTQSEELEYTWDDSYNNNADTIQNRYTLDGKQRGMHVFGRSEMDEFTVKGLMQTNMEWITLVPFGGQEDYDSEFVGRRGTDYSTWSHRDSSFMNRIRELKTRGFYIMVKPHIWMHNASSGKWRSDISQKTEEGWQTWSESYRQFIFHYARMSELLDVELFCVGTELHKVAIEHPDFWKQIILDIKKIYSGKITYAANWNEELIDVTFWDQLDYIGVQAYYPLTNKTTPSVRELKKGWKKHLDSIEKVQKKFNKPVIFSELGYKSTDCAAIEPWIWPNNFKGLYKKVSYQTQANCYEAFFQTFWDKEWFAGVHFWEWQTGRRHNSDKKNINFTPQQKPAENIMTKWFAKLGKLTTSYH